jgi:hypothetical protein
VLVLAFESVFLCLFPNYVTVLKCSYSLRLFDLTRSDYPSFGFKVSPALPI